MFFSIFALSLIASAVSQALGVKFTPTETYERKEFLDRDKNVKLYWKFDERNIMFEIHAKTEGWVGVGFSPKPGMRNADIVVGWVKGGRAYVTDRHGPAYGNGFPDLDVSQDVELIAGRECEGITMIKFRRRLKPCDTDDQTIEEDTLKVLYAYGMHDPENNHLSWGDMHLPINRGSKSVMLLTGMLPPLEYDNEHEEHFDLLNNGHPIPVQDTYYNCKLFQIPELDRKHHVIEFEPIIDENFVANVHHMAIKVCDKTPAEGLVGQNQRCHMETSFREMYGCHHFIGGWAVGGKTVYLPKEAGYPIGTDDSPKYLLIETHYDNPNLIEIRDHSGFRIHYTAQLRKYDAGQLSIGVPNDAFKITIPPGQDAMDIYGQCNPECLAAAMEATGIENITVFATFPHTHLAGKSVFLHHLRNGTELPYIMKDEHYDFNFQVSRHLTQWRVVRKGDTLLTRCVYDTSRRNKTTYGGSGTRDEMCMNFMHYYPKLPISSCVSYPKRNTALLLGILNITRWKLNPTPADYYHSFHDIVISKPDHMANMTLSEAMDRFDWSNKNMNIYKRKLQQSLHRGVCISPHAIKIADKPLVNIQHQYVERKTDCSSLRQPVTTGLSPECTSQAFTTGSNGNL